MIIFIPGELVALVTFPGVMLHEIAHRFACDIQGVRVYAVNYFNLGSKEAGHVLHEPVNSCARALLIAVAPLIINSLVCIFLTIPVGVELHFKTDFLLCGHGWLAFFRAVLAWIGLSAGFNAIPSRDDMKNLPPTSFIPLKVLIFIVNAVVFLSSIPYIGFIVSGGYAFFLSLVIPTLFL